MKRTGVFDLFLEFATCMLGRKYQSARQQSRVRHFKLRSSLGESGPLTVCLDAVALLQTHLLTKSKDDRGNYQRSDDEKPRQKRNEDGHSSLLRQNQFVLATVRI
jgi:hypothetical protein